MCLLIYDKVEKHKNASSNNNNNLEEVEVGACANKSALPKASK